MKDCEIEKHINLDDSEGCSEGEDDLFDVNRLEFSSESESENSDVPDNILEINTEYLDEDLLNEEGGYEPPEFQPEEDALPDSPWFPPPEISTPPPRRGRPSRRSRGISRGRRATRGRSQRRGISRGQMLTRGRPRCRGRGARIRARGISRRSFNETRAYYKSVDWNGTKLLNDVPIQLNQPAYISRDRSDWGPYDYINDYVDDSLLNNIVLQTNRSAILKTGKSLGLTLKELKVFLGINFVMSCLNYPHIRMYWSKKWRVPLIAEAMERDRFFKIRTSLKIVYDDDITAEERLADKIWKVRPLFDRVLEGCMLQERSQHICIDEMMIPFTGSCGLRQYVPNKPHPVGLKIFVLANPNGIVCDMFVSQGDTTFSSDLTEEFISNECAVLKLTESLVPGHILYFDRYFTSLKLVKTLLDRGFLSAGTLMKNRIPKEVYLMSDADMRRVGRGCCHSMYSTDEMLALTKWFDNKPVIMLSSCYASEKTDMCRRWSKKKKEYEMVVRPEVIKQYNTNMGGVDLIDRMIAVCPSRARTKKWTIRFTFHCFDLAVANSWLLYRSDAITKNKPAKEIEQLRTYKLRLGQKMIEENDVSSDEDSNGDNESEGELQPKHKKRRVEICPIPSTTRRTQKAAHLPIMTEKQSRCRLVGCNKKSRTKCCKCNIYFCLTINRNCYYQFHTTNV